MSYFRSLSLFTKLLLVAFLGLILVGLTVSPTDEFPNGSAEISEFHPRPALVPSATSPN